MVEARTREVYNRGEKTLNMGKMSVNNTKKNSTIKLPDQMDNQKEAGLNIRRAD